ncbi:hypothetical protein TrVE_jg5952 [Triparma verrucosa]|uniref:BTB domain-containing protein n=1 Tax=Triparma verrucosa TaxID=1606542 RepID=A0A9W7ERY7_9STRA|nr:hypothetical protein TrVE_jg5952 [Triparma verrucosa]
MEFFSAGSAFAPTLATFLALFSATSFVLNCYVVHLLSQQLRESVKAIEEMFSNRFKSQLVSPKVPADLFLSTPQLPESPPVPPKETSKNQIRQKICINVGGTQFYTSKETIISNEENYFSSLLRFRSLQSIDKDSESGSDSDADSGLELDNSSDSVDFFVDRDPTHFRHILNYLRDGGGDCHLTSLTSISELLVEAKYFQVGGLISQLEEKLSIIKKEKDEGKSSEKEYKLVHVGNLQNMDGVFKTWISRGYEFEQIMQITNGGVQNTWSSQSSPASPTRRNLGNSNPPTSPDGKDDFRFVIVLSKSLTNADVTFFDRLMKSSG